MKKRQIKVCGLTTPDNIERIAALDVDMLGFIFYPPSPRCILGKTSPLQMVMLGAGKKKVGVFVNETLAKVCDTANLYRLDMVQLHGQESPEYCQLLRIKFGILKAFPIASAADFEATKTYEGVCDYFLFDTKGPSHGGNGFAFDWTVLEAYTGNTPFLLSGGIAPDDVEKIEALKHPKLEGVDLNSRFETSPGVKDPNLLTPFIQQLALANSHPGTTINASL